MTLKMYTFLVALLVIRITSFPRKEDSSFDLIRHFLFTLLRTRIFAAAISQPNKERYL